MLHTQFILASASPRRVELLQQCGILFTQMRPEINEEPLAKESPLESAKRLALEKARAILACLQNQSVPTYVLAADTIVTRNHVIYGKPRDHHEALAFLTELQGKTHQVITAYTIVQFPANILCQREIVSEVTLKRLTKAQMEDYVKTGEPMDKAGAYAAQGMGRALIESIRGSWSNVVGLPLESLKKDLAELKLITHNS